jgi:radical SAM enzyme (TIGR01210 family)
MCDLWQNTLTESVPLGAIPEQIDRALAVMTAGDPAPRQIKLYNSGSFFDPRAVPRDDHPAIAQRVGRFERVIVECHPSLVDEEVLRFRDRLAGRLEVAMGLETAHPEVLEKLNKGMTLEDFARAAEFLLRHGIALRAFVLVRPPFLPAEDEARHWAKRSIGFAFDCGASVASLIPTRGGNGAMEALEALGQFSPPRLADLEAAADYGVGLQRGRVFADLWDLEKLSQCARCCDARRQRLRRMNLGQQVEPPVRCEACGTPAHGPLSG